MTERDVVVLSVAALVGVAVMLLWLRWTAPLAAFALGSVAAGLTYWLFA